MARRSKCFFFFRAEIKQKWNEHTYTSSKWLWQRNQKRSHSAQPNRILLFIFFSTTFPISLGRPSTCVRALVNANASSLWCVWMRFCTQGTYSSAWLSLFSAFYDLISNSRRWRRATNCRLAFCSLLSSEWGLFYLIGDSVRSRSCHGRGIEGWPEENDKTEPLQTVNYRKSEIPRSFRRVERRE